VRRLTEAYEKAYSGFYEKAHGSFHEKGTFVLLCIAL